MKEKEKLQNIADLEGLQLITTTSAANGYPQDLRYALIGFEDFDDAEEIAKSHGLRIEEFDRRQGWDLWHRTGNRAYEEFKIRAEDFGDNCRMFTNADADTIYKEVARPLLEYADNINEASSIVEDLVAVRDALLTLSDDEALLYFGRGNFETCPMRSMRYAYDTKEFVIGCVCDDTAEDVAIEDKKNKIRILKENYRLSNGAEPFAEWCELESQSDPDFFRWLTGNRDIEDFGSNLTEEIRKELLAELN